MNVKLFAGRWQLRKNSENFEKFLVYYGYGYLRRKVALITNAVVTLYSMDNSTLYKVVDSTFLKLDEYMKTDGLWSEPNSEGLVKTHVLQSEKVMISKIRSTKDENIYWEEITEVNGKDLTITRKWGEHKVTQLFTRLT
jgi:hypothetical protein